MPSVIDRDTKLLIDQIVAEIRSIQTQNRELLSFERACAYKKKLIWFQEELAVLTPTAQEQIRTFLRALEGEVTRLFEMLEAKMEPTALAAGEPRRVIPLYPHLQPPAAPLPPVETPAPSSPRLESGSAQALLGLVRDHVRLLAARTQPIEPAELKYLSQVLDQAVRAAENPASVPE